MEIQQLLFFFLNKKRTMYFLIGITVLISLLSFFTNLHATSGDEYTYMYYVNGFQQNRYSYWYFLDDYIPDTFRNPGFPLFLYALSFVSISVLFVKAIQLLLLFLTLFLMFKIISTYDDSVVLKNLFLLFVNINFVVLSYAAFIFPETLMLFLITLIVYLEISFYENNWKKIVLLALLYGYCFQVRPVIIFIPIFRFLYYLYQYRKQSVVKNLSFIFIFILTLLPYGCWNLKQHKQFKITPIEGGAGAMYLGYWSPKMINHIEDKLWRNVMYKDLLFNFADMDEVPHNIELFNREIDSVSAICSKYISTKDSVNLLEMKIHSNLFVTYNTNYTKEREEILKSLAITHYLQDWQYTIKLKSYTIFRLWYTGFSIDKFERQKQTIVKQLPTIVAFIGTAVTLLLFIVYFSFCLFKRREILVTLIFPCLLCLYFTVFHLPFVIQSRYTIPVRLLYLFSLSFMIYKIHFTKNTTNESHQNI